MSLRILAPSAMSSTISTIQRAMDRVTIPGPLKWLVLIVVLINIKSWPLVWHVRVLHPVVRVVLRDFFHALRVRLSQSSEFRKELEDRWIDDNCLVGKNPFDYRGTFHTRATMEECDWNIHLSNTSYGKILDYTRFEVVLALFPLFCRSGGTMALGASNFHFIREIPMGHRFEIRTSVRGWDNKWLFLVSKFVVLPTSRQKASSQAQGEVKKSIPTEPDGSIIHAISIVHICFKAGRITVPPAIALASNGFSAPPSPSTPSCASSTAYSSMNPPPHWTIVKELASPKHGGSLSKYLAFLRSGWKDLPENERWWETALGGEVEQKRVAAMADLSGLHRAFEGARTI